MLTVFWLLLAFFAINKTLAADVSFESSVVKLQVYDYNAGTKFFTKIQLGSALHIGSGLLISNSHVVLKEDNTPASFIEVCGIIDGGAKTQCGITATVVYYDPDIDLALLKISTSVSTPLLKMSSVDPVTWDPIINKGFPWDGLDTITITQGTVWGIYNEYYKIDATINWGNSGGGTFDKNYALLGIPTFKVGNGGLGYIIPVSHVKEFLNKEGNIITQTIVAPSVVLTKAFQKYLQLADETKNKKTIGAKAFSFPLPVSFKILNSETNSDGLFYYQLRNTKSKVDILITNEKIYGYDNSKENFRAVVSDYKKSFSSVTTGSKVLSGITWNYINADSYNYDKSQSVKTYFATIGDERLQYQIMGDKKAKDFMIAEESINNLKLLNLGKTKVSLPFSSYGISFPINKEFILNRKIEESYYGGFTTVLHTALPWNSTMNEQNTEEFSLDGFSIQKLEESDISEKKAEDLILWSNSAYFSYKGLVHNSQGSLFYLTKNSSSDSLYDTLTTYSVRGFVKVDDNRYEYNLTYSYEGADEKKDKMIESYLDQIKVEDSNDFLEWDSQAVDLEDLVNNKKTVAKFDVDINSIVFKDYGAKNTTRYDETMKNLNPSIIWSSQIKLLLTESSIYAGQDLQVKWYAKNVRNMKITLVTEQGGYQALSSVISLDSESPSGTYSIKIPSYLQGKQAMILIGAVTKDGEALEDYSSLITIQ